MTPRVVIVGGGISGLSTAYFVRQQLRGADVTVVEARTRVGGNIHTVVEQGYLMDAGPDSFLVTKPAALELCRELGLEPELIQTRESARRVYFAHEGALTEMPGGMALAVPTRVEPLLTTPLLSKKGKLRMLSEPMVPKRAGEEDESIHAFLSRRFGVEAAERLAGPILSGVYAGDTHELSIRATFPQLSELEQQHGSLVRGLFAAQQKAGGPTLWQWLRRAPAAHPPSPFRSLRGGLGALVGALQERLPEGTVRPGVTVEAIVRVPGGYQVRTSEGLIEADVVVLAVPARRAAPLVPDEDIASDLARVPFVSTATVFFGFDQGAVDHALDGLGFVAPKGEASILAGTWVSSKWPERAPGGKVLMRAFVGGAHGQDRLEGASDDDLAELCLAELRRLMGRLGEPEMSRVFRYEKASAQPVVGHLALMERVFSRLEAFPGLFIAGSGYDGIGIPDCVRQAHAIAEAIAAPVVEARAP